MVGDRVVHLPTSKYVGWGINPPVGTHGEVIGKGWNGSYDVKWDNGMTNTDYELGRDIA